MGTPLKNADVWTNYSGADYASARPAYPPGIYDVILNYHKATMGLCETALDLGCGPGTVTKDLATRFDRVFGSDISEKMYNSAPSLPNVKFHTASASSLPFLEDQSVDLATAGTSAHWFDHAAWWGEMSRVVKPKGSVAVWTWMPGFLPDGEPSSYPKSLVDLLYTTQRYSKPFFKFRTPGNQLTYSLYDTLPGPNSDVWEAEPKRFRWGWTTAEEYGAKEMGNPWEWDVLPAKGADNEELERAMRTEMTLEDLAAYFASVSPVLSYRAAKPKEEKDWIEAQLEKILAEGEPEWTSKTRVKLRRVLGLVIWKKK